MFSAALLEKAKRAKSKEELMALAKENSISLADGEAEYYLALLNDPSIYGEVGDDELDDVSGGGCKKTVDGKKHKVVSARTECFNGQYYRYNPVIRKGGLRDLWEFWGSDHCCGWCDFLGFKDGVGYCKREFDHWY